MLKSLFLTLVFCTSSAYAAIAPTDIQMKESDARMELSLRLRAKIMSDEQLSTQAHNVSIITNEESITLKGKVATRAEKVKLENYARSLAGRLKVFNQLEYKR